MNMLRKGKSGAESITRYVKICDTTPPRSNSLEFCFQWPVSPVIITEFPLCLYLS